MLSIKKDFGEHHPRQKLRNRPNKIIAVNLYNDQFVFIFIQIMLAWRNIEKIIT